MALRAIETLLESADGVGILDHAKQLTRLERRLASCVEPGLMSNCRLANFRDGVLVLQVPSGVWAARLRYELPRLQACMRNAGVMVEQVEVNVVPARGTPMPPCRTISISPSSRGVLLDAATSVTYPALSAALRRLAHAGE